MEDKGQGILPEAVRLNRFLAMSGVASRRHAETFIVNGDVKVNGKIVTDLATKIRPGIDTVLVMGKRVTGGQNLVYILLYKPKDYITTVSDERGRRKVMDLVDVRERIYPVGRLDRNTTGALLLTNDGVLATRLMHPSSRIYKSYHVSLTTSLGEQHAEKLEKGVYVEGGKTLPASIDFIPGTKRKEIVITIHEGRNRQVRKMFESLGYEIQKLHRISYAGITLESLSRGKWRYLSDKEVKKLQQLVQQQKT